MSQTEAISIEEFKAEHWEYFSQFEKQFEKGFEHFSRNIPSECYDELKSKLLELMIQVGINGKFMITVVIDANIIVADSLRAAKGLLSSTERILDSKFIRPIAPSKIKDEVHRNLEAKLTGQPLALALIHAERLLSKIDMSSEASADAISKARSMIPSHEKDVPFLASFFESKADAIISYEIGTYDKPCVCRWKTKDMVDVVVKYESGSFAFFVAGAAFELLLEIFISIALFILNTIYEIVRIVESLISDFVKGIGNLPDWAKIVLIGIGIGTVIAMILDEGFRNRIIDGLKVIMDKLIETIQVIWEAIKELLILIWNVSLPYTTKATIVAGVLIKRILTMIQMAIDLQKKAGAQSYQ